MKSRVTVSSHRFDFADILQLLEVGLALVEGPAGVAAVGPGVVVEFVTAHVDHRVDGVRAAGDLAAPPVRSLHHKQSILSWLVTLFYQ